MRLRRAKASALAKAPAAVSSRAHIALFYPDLASVAIQGRHLDYHWDGTRVDLYRDAGNGKVLRIVTDHLN